MGHKKSRSFAEERHEEIKARIESNNKKIALYSKLSLIFFVIAMTCWIIKLIIYILQKVI